MDWEWHLLELHLCVDWPLRLMLQVALQVPEHLRHSVVHHWQQPGFETDFEVVDDFGP